MRGDRLALSGAGAVPETPAYAALPVGARRGIVVLHRGFFDRHPGAASRA